MSLAGVSQLFVQESSSRARVLVPYTPSLSGCKRTYMQFAYLGSLCLQVTQAKGVEVGREAALELPGRGEESPPPSKMHTRRRPSQFERSILASEEINPQELHPDFPQGEAWPGAQQDRRNATSHTGFFREENCRPWRGSVN